MLLNYISQTTHVQTLELDDHQCPTPATSHHLAEALCSMPNLTDLELKGGDLTEEFFSTLKAKAPFIQVYVSKCQCHGGGH